MNLRDSRRLTGPNILWHRPSAVIDVGLEETESAEDLIEAWERHARRALDAVGWAGEDLATRVFASGVSLALSAPVGAQVPTTPTRKSMPEDRALLNQSRAFSTRSGRLSCIELPWSTTQIKSATGILVMVPTSQLWTTRALDAARPDP